MNDLISRQAAIDTMDFEVVSTNPEHFKSSKKFIKFMNDADIASFGKWQWANGFNTAVVAAKIQLEKLPSAEPKRIWHPVETPPTHHRDVIVRGIEAIGRVTVHKVMQWDVDTWRPTNYAPSISWKEWSEIDE